MQQNFNWAIFWAVLAALLVADGVRLAVAGFLDWWSDR